MEITIPVTKNNINEYFFDITSFDFNDLDCTSIIKNTVFPVYRSLENRGKNFYGYILRKNSNGSFDRIDDFADCHEILLRKSSNADNTFIIGAWTKTNLELILPKILKVLVLIKENNNFEAFPEINIFCQTKPSLGEQTSSYGLFMDFTDCDYYFNSMCKKQFLFRLFRWAITYQNLEKEHSTNFNFEDLLQTSNISQGERESDIQDNIQQHKKELLKMCSDWNCLNNINMEDRLFFENISGVVELIKKNKNKKFYPLKLISRHPTHRPLKGMLVEKPCVLRLGLLKNEDAVKLEENNYFVLNKKEAVLNSASKFLMKRCFEKHNVKTAEFCIPKTPEELKTWLSSFKEEQVFIIKSEFGSRGTGLWLVKNPQEAISWFEREPINKKQRYGNYLIERYYNYNKEYRLHVSKNGCFYTNRKMLKKDAETRWYRNDSNCVWILENNPLFKKPQNWREIERQCVNALHAVGLDLGACDVRVQSGDEKSPNFIICEINSAPSFGATTLTKYQEEIKLICADS